MRKITADEKEQICLSENGALKKLPSKFKYRMIKLDDYYSPKSGGCGVGGIYPLQSICARYPYGKDINDFTTLIECDTPQLFLATISLIAKLQNEFDHPTKRRKQHEKNQEPVDKNETAENDTARKNRERIKAEADKIKYEKTPYFAIPERILYFDVAIRPKAIKLITQWCKDYGFPFIPEEYEKPKVKSLFEGYEPKSHVHFTVSKFLFELYRVYGAFRIYQKLTGNVEQGDDAAIIFTRCKTSKQPMQQVRMERLGSLSYEECEDRFRDMYLDRKFSCQVSFIDGKAHTEIIADTVFDAVYYELAMLLNEPERKLKKCPICHTYFEPNHVSRKYCYNPRCTPQNAFKRKLRTKQKEAADE